MDIYFIYNLIKSKKGISNILILLQWVFSKIGVVSNKKNEMWVVKGKLNKFSDELKNPESVILDHANFVRKIT